MFYAKHRKTHKERAVKIVSVEQNDYGNLTEDKLRCVAANEERILRKMSHPNISHLYEVYEDNESFALVTDFFEGGDILSEILKKEQKHF